MIFTDIPHVPETKETADSDAQESSAEESLTQKFLKASHNMVNIIHSAYHTKQVDKGIYGDYIFFTCLMLYLIME